MYKKIKKSEIAPSIRKHNIIFYWVALVGGFRIPSGSSGSSGWIPSGGFHVPTSEWTILIRLTFGSDKNKIFYNSQKEEPKIIVELQRLVAKCGKIRNI